MSITLPYTSESFSLDYRPEQQLLIGRWLCPVSLAELQTHYEALLASAQAHDCRHWLLDTRRRSINDEAAVQWFGDVFTPRLSAVFTKPVYLAYFAMIAHNQATTNPGLDANIRQGCDLGMHYRYFNQEGDCLDWLALQA